MRKIFTTVILLSLFSISHAEESKCKKNYKHFEGRCYCADELNNLEVTTPTGTKVAAVCSLTGAKGKLIDLTRSKVSLDRFDSTGNYFDGIIYLSGELILSGSVWYEPGDAGDLHFRVDNNNRSTTPVFLNEFFNEIKLESEDVYRKLGAPIPVYGEPPQCWGAQVTLKIIDPVVKLYANDSGGTYGTNIVVLKKSALNKLKCYE
jgi:hypothetical protein